MDWPPWPASTTTRAGCGADAPAVINWRKERDRLESFLARMPFRVPLDRPVSSLAAGEKAYTDAKLVFSCIEGDCALAQIWTGSPEGAYELSPPKGGWNGRIRVEIKSTN